MEPIGRLGPGVARGLWGIFFDIDDTFTTRGRIPAAAFAALWRLQEAGLRVVPITGRPAGWCDHIARMWPVDAVVGENGAFYFWHDEGGQRLGRRYVDSGEARAANRVRLEAIRREVLAEVPGAAVASDQAYREADLAVDFCEDVAPLGWAAVEQICTVFGRHGATCKVSSIHVNGWFGAYDKLSTARLLARELWGVELDEHRERFLYCGDSPNDEPMFRFFPHAAGVRNVLAFEGRMTHWPAYLAEAGGGEGFAEIAEAVLARRGGGTPRGGGG